MRDCPNQKSTSEIYITVPEKYTTLSNGLLQEQIENLDGTRTDYWNFTQKHVDNSFHDWSFIKVPSNSLTFSVICPAIY